MLMCALFICFLFCLFSADRNISLGINLSSMAKILKCSGNDDIITLKAEDNGDQVAFLFESPSNKRKTYTSIKHVQSCWAFNLAR